MQQNFKLTSVITPEIFKRFALFDMYKRRKVWRNPLLFGLILGASSIIIFLYRERAKGAVALGTVLLIVAIILPLFYFISFRQSLKVQLKALAKAGPIEAYTAEINSERLHFHSAAEDVNSTWDDMYHVYRNRDALYAYVEVNKAFILTEAADSVTGEALWAFVQEHLPSDKCTDLT